MDGRIFKAGIETDGSISVLSLEGDIDLATAPVVRAQFDGLAEANLTHVVVDGSGISFVDSTGFGAFLSGREAVLTKGSDVVLVPSRAMQRLLDLVSPNEQILLTVESVDHGINLIRERISQTW